MVNDTTVVLEVEPTL
jgi:hypothetical protein